MLLTLAAIQFTTVLDFMVIMPLAPQFTRVFELSAQQFGWLISAYTFAAAIAGFAAALVIERFERKRLLLAVYVGFVAAAAITASAQSFSMLLMARALAGIFGGVLYGVIFTVIGDTIPEARRGRATGVVMTSFAVATVAGVPLALLLSNAFNWRAAFVVVALSGAINALIARRTLPNCVACDLCRSQRAQTACDVERVRAHADFSEPPARIHVHAADDDFRIHGHSIRQLVHGARTSVCRRRSCRWCIWREESRLFSRRDGSADGQTTRASAWCIAGSR